MTAIPTADALRTLNLAYRKMQEDFRLFAPELFRRSESLTTDATNGYLTPDVGVHEIEGVWDANNNALMAIDKKQRFYRDGWFLDGMDATGSGNFKKRQIAVYKNGAASLSTAYTVDFLEEYADLTATSDPAYPFTSKVHLDMLTTLQAYYWMAEQGQSRHKEKRELKSDYESDLKDAMLHYQHDHPEYLETTHSDAGIKNSRPYLNTSSS